jgi:hypothetical protein
LVGVLAAWALGAALVSPPAASATMSLTSGVASGATDSPPECPGDSASTAFETAVTITFSCSGNDLSYSVQSGPSYGTLGSIAGDQVTYTPEAGFSGQDTFEVLATGADSQSATDVVTVTISPPTSPPACSAVGASTAFETAVTITFSCSGNDLSYSVQSGPSDGTLGSIAGDQVTYTPEAGFSGRDTFEVLATTADSESATEAVTVTVSPSGPPPACSGDRAATGIATAIPVTFTCTGSGLTYSVKSGPSDGTLGPIQGDQVVYTPAADFSGQDTFEVLATDAAGRTATDTVTVTVALGIGPPAVEISSPSSRAVFRFDQVVHARYSCVDNSGGGGLTACRGSVANGRDIDTSRAGRHQFTVMAVSRDGDRTTDTVTYTVGASSNHFTVSRVHVQGDGIVTFELELPAPGTVTVLETAPGDLATGTSLKRVAGRLLVASKRVTVRRAGAVEMTIASGAAVRRLIGLYPDKVVLRLQIGYTPSGGRPRSVELSGLHVG